MVVPDRALAARFLGRRTATRACFLGALVASAASAASSEPHAAALLEYLAIAAAGLTFLLYFGVCNRCPRCRRSFSRSPAYQGETDGLALFHRIARCPFCEIPLER
jgi:hypothetical protein